MNRAERLYSVLKDGRTYSRLEIFERVGFMLTNNAASELRAIGFNVEHRREQGNDVYRLVLGEAPEPPSSCASFPQVSGASPRTPASNLALSSLGAAVSTEHTSGRDGAGVLTLFGDAA